MASKNLSISVWFAVILIASLAAVPAPVLAASAADSSDVIQDHVIRFYLDPVLVPDLNLAKVVLTKYVGDMNLILSKNTSRRLVFNPETGIILSTNQPHSNQALPPLPNGGFEIWAHATHTNYSVSYGGYAGIDDSGAGVLAGLNWTRLYDPDALQPAEVSDYWTQINNMLHELAHVFGAGIGEYYKLAVVQDTTGEAPVLPINIFDPNDPFWSTKQDFMADPLLKNAAQSDILGQKATRQTLLDYVKFSALTAKIISAGYRNGIPLNDLSQIKLNILSDETGLPLGEAQVKIWSVRGGAPYESQTILESVSNSNGEISFAWGAGLADPHNSYDFLRLIKVYKEGYQPAAQYVSIFDADIDRLVNGSFSWTITIRLKGNEALTPAEATFTDVPTDNFAWSYIEQLYDANITGGCSTTPLLYCPEQIVTRGQMAIFLERSMRGADFVPPTEAIRFNDTADHWARYWIEVLAADGITSGCGNGNYCPDQPVTRGQMAIFLLRAKYGKDYAPPAPTGTKFQDVPQDHWAAGWIEQFSAEGITSGCGNGNYCPDQPVTRAQMAVFLAKSFKFQ